MSRHPGPSKKRIAASIRRHERNTHAWVYPFETAMSTPEVYSEPDISIPLVEVSRQVLLLLTLKSMYVDRLEGTPATEYFQAPFPFMRLPAEIRIFILDIALIGAVQTCARKPSHSNEEQPTSVAIRNVEAQTGLALTLTCKLLHNEGMPTYYGRTTFQFYSLGVFRRFLAAIGPTKYHCISSIRFKATDMLMWQILVGLRSLKLLRFELDEGFSSPSCPGLSTKLEELCQNSESLQRIEIAPFAPSRPMCRCGVTYMRSVDQQLVARMNKILAAKGASGMEDLNKKLGEASLVGRLDESVHKARFLTF
ncbi:MAG: hypothetical protein Q9187_002167 [Circinaria calcarea]